MDLNNTAKIFKALSDVKRLEILKLLQYGEMCSCVMQEELSIPQSTLSHHMKVLVEGGIVMGRRDGKWTHYSISGPGREQAINALKMMTSVSPLQTPKSC